MHRAGIITAWELQLWNLSFAGRETLAENYSMGPQSGLPDGLPDSREDTNSIIKVYFFAGAGGAWGSSTEGVL